MYNKTKPNDYIYPELNSDYCEGIGYRYYTDGNLTKREYFAAMALQGLLAYGALYGAEGDAVDIADKLINELNKEIKNG